MGNFFSQYDPAKHCCTPGAQSAPTRRAQAVQPQSSSPKGLPRVFRKTLHASSENHIKKGHTTSRISHSETADKRRAGFLDLPAELRNNIYSRVLIYDGYVRLTLEQPTKVPALRLLRVCKQVHDEAASVFYAANSFYCYVRKHIKIELGAKLLIPEIPPDSLHMWSNSTVLDTRGVFFPAPRYHVWLTRITIDTRVELTVPMGNSRGDSYPTSKEYAQANAAYIDARDEIVQFFEPAFQKMKALWEEKDSKWEGKWLCTHDVWAPKVLHFSTSFYEDEEDELATKRALRNWKWSR